MVEEWENEEALHAHLAQPWLKEALKWLRPMAAERPAVTRLRDVSEA
jgi:quinol monooxygenase YgiN